MDGAGVGTFSCLRERGSTGIGRVSGAVEGGKYTSSIGLVPGIPG
jgi:hypothetical protein